MVKELSYKQIRKCADPESLNFDTTEHLTPLDGIIGQPRAVSSLRFGLGIQEVGFNVFVSGPRGMGKMTAVKSFLEELAKNKPTPSDWCYVNDFNDGGQPKALRLPAGRGKEFQQDVKKFVEFIYREIRKLFETDEYNTKHDQVVSVMQNKRDQLMREFNQGAIAEGFTLQTTQMGVVLLPSKEGHAMSEEEWTSISQLEQDKLIEKRKALEEKLKVVLKEVRLMERTAQQAVMELDKQAVRFFVSGALEDLKEKYKNLSDAAGWFDDIQNDVLENIESFKQSSDGKEKEEDVPSNTYQVNLFVDNSKQEGVPVVLEINPTYHNLFGRIEKDVYQGTMFTDFTMIKPGALHRANGGYIVLQIEDVLKHFMSWDGLKRALRSRAIQIEDVGESMGMTSTKTIRPQPIPLDVKVILIGRSMMYYFLHEQDDDFPELFKVKADFDTSMDRDDKNTHDFLTFISTLCNKENLKHLNGPAAAKLIEFASRLADDQEKLSTHFAAMADVIREAHYWAVEDQAAQIREIHIQKALDEKVYRSNLIQKRIQELITQKVFLIDTDAAVIGQINGLAVIRMGSYEFGRPSRITASVGPGTEGIIDIERQVKLGGPIHSKGVLILNGFMSGTFGSYKPLTLSCRLVFEQSYEGVDGDSASSTELYTILSALAQVPLKQGIAVTGSVNQKGEIQAIGGVNEKIEGYYEICSAMGLTGKQGVMIPRSNVQNLMLREDIVEAVKKGKFHIWAVATIQEGIEILTGKPAGERMKNGTFPRKTIFHLVEKRLDDFASQLKKGGKPVAKKRHSKNNKSRAQK
ncbi:AAA family ATPase [bacterium]|nr:AAA family ATPase [bacterium]